MANDTPDDKPVQAISNLQSLHLQAEDTQPVFEQAMQDFLSDLKERNAGRYDSVVFHLGPIKTLERINEKLDSDYSGKPNRVLDLVRGTFTADSPQALTGVQEALLERFEVVRVKDKIAEPSADTGWRNYHNNIRMPNGHIVETQILPSQLWAIKEQSHDLMENTQKLKREYPKDVERPPEVAAEIRSIDKQNRLMANVAVHDTGLNAMLNPDWDHRQQAPFVVTFDMQGQFAQAAPLDLSGIEYEPEVLKTKLNFPETKGIILTAGVITLVGGSTLIMTGSPAEAGNAMLETAKPDYWDASMFALNGDYDDAFVEAVRVTPGVLGCGGGSVLGAFGGGGWGSLFTGAAGCEGGAMIANDLAHPYVDQLIAEYRYPTAQREADLAAQQAITPDPEILALHAEQRNIEQAERNAALDDGVGTKLIPGLEDIQLSPEYFEMAIPLENIRAGLPNDDFQSQRLQQLLDDPELPQATRDYIEDQFGPEIEQFKAMSDVSNENVPALQMQGAAYQSQAAFALK